MLQWAHAEHEHKKNSVVNNSNYYQHQQNSNYVPTYSGTNYDDKVEFFDAYRELDQYLADFVGDTYRGVAYLRSGMIGYGKQTGQQCWFEMLNS